MNERVTPVNGDEGDKTLTRGLMQDPERLRWRRIAAGLTIAEAADKSGVSTGWLSYLENGLYSARVKALRKLATAYGCDIADLMPADPGLAGAAAERRAS